MCVLETIKCPREKLLPTLLNYNKGVLNLSLDSKMKKGTLRQIQSLWKMTWVMMGGEHRWAGRKMKASSRDGMRSLGLRVSLPQSCTCDSDHRKAVKSLSSDQKHLKSDAEGNTSVGSLRQKAKPSCTGDDSIFNWIIQEALARLSLCATPALCTVAVRATRQFLCCWDINATKQKQTTLISWHNCRRKVQSTSGFCLRKTSVLNFSFFCHWPMLVCPRVVSLDFLSLKSAGDP